MASTIQLSTLGYYSVVGEASQGSLCFKMSLFPTFFCLFVCFPYILKVMSFGQRKQNSLKTHISQLLLFFVLVNYYPSS